MGARGSEIIGAVALLHLISGFLIIFNESGAFATRTFDIWRLLPNGVDQYVVGLAGIAAGVCGIIGLARNGVGVNPKGVYWFLLPLTLLWASTCMAAIAITEGAFGDGEPRSRVFIFVDQIGTFAFLTGYVWALLNRYAEGWDRLLTGRNGHH